MNKNLLEPIFDQGIQNTNFFNGRVLTAADMQAEQVANRRQRQQLGRAIGAGVVAGLEVRLADDGASGGPPVLEVAGGLALNRLGQAVELAAPVQVALARKVAAPPADAGLFGDCAPLQRGPDTTGKGAYILTVAPASGFREKVPRVGFGDNGVAAGCGSRYAVEGVSFGLIELEPGKLTAIGQATRDAIAGLMVTSEQNSLPAATRQADMSKLRNMLAHVCFGTEELAGFAPDPLRRVGGGSPYVSYGALDALLGRGTLTDCDVPLALVYWTQYGVRFVDMWAVRRRPVAPPIAAAWPLPVAERRAAESEAIFQQFQGHVAALVGQQNAQIALTARKASAYFQYLPPAGIVPLPYDTSTRGFAYGTFFQGLTTRAPIFIEGSRVEPFFRSALAFPPQDLGSKVMLWLYCVRENVQAIEAAPANPPLAYLIFASGHVPFYGEARYDVSRWDYSNFV